MFLSKYSSLVTIENKHYFLNTYNSALIELDDAVFERIKAAKTDGKIKFSAEELDLLASEGFLVDENEELQRELLVKFKYHRSKYVNGSKLKIDIGITDRCNFACPYCFENGHKNTGRFGVGKFTYTELYGELRNYILTHINSDTKDVEIVWYGGEPSLEYDFICFTNEKLIADAASRGFQYSNIIITNGYELDVSHIEKLKNQHIKYIQITLDGLQKTHDSRRNTFPKTNAFETIVNNIELLLESSLEVVIRINIDALNCHEIDELLDFLAGRFDKKRIEGLLFVSFGRVFGSVNSLTFIEYEEIYHQLYLKAAKLGFISPNFDNSEVSAFCGAETMNNSLVVDFKGNIYKCWNDIFDESSSVGNIIGLTATNARNKATELLYMEHLSLDNVNAGKCLSCEYIKYCGGLCPYNRKMLMEEKEKNIYENQVCKDIVRRRLETHIEAYLNQS